MLVGGWSSCSKLCRRTSSMRSLCTLLPVRVYNLDARRSFMGSYIHSIALAAVSCLRSLAGFGFPLFAPAMYAKLGYGKGDTVLACFAIGLGCPAWVLFIPFFLSFTELFISLVLLVLFFSGNTEREYGWAASMRINHTHRVVTVVQLTMVRGMKELSAQEPMIQRRRDLTLMGRKREHQSNRHCGPGLQGSPRVHCLMQRWRRRGKGNLL